MAVPVYSTDLTTLAIGSITVDAGTWDESSDAAWDDAGSMVDDGNLYYNGAACVSAQFTKDGVGTIMYEHTSSVTVPTDGAILIHSMWAAPPALASLADGGARSLVGNGFGVFYSWDCNGTDTHKGSIWTQYAINPAIGSPDDTIGSPASPYNTFGMAISATAQARGNPNAVNAIRYGRCEVVYTEGDTTTPSTFDGWASIDDLVANKYGLTKYVEGGLKQQGLHSFGTAATAVYFEDTSVKIVIEDTINTTSAFNKYEVVNASSVLKWTDVSITALGTNSKGHFVATDNATIEKKACSFTGMDYFTYQSNSSITDITKYTGCGVITQNDATFTDCVFSSCAPMVVDNLGAVTGCSYISSGTGHGLNLGTISSTQSVSWGNTDTGYTDASSGNETILVNVDSGVTLTISVGDGASTPSVYNTGLGTVVISNTKSKTFTGIPENAEIRVRQGSYTLAHQQDVTGGSYQFNYSPDGSKPATVQFSLSGYIIDSIDILLDSVNQTLPVTSKPDPSYQ